MKQSNHIRRNRRFVTTIGLASSVLGIADFLYGLDQAISDQEDNKKIRLQLQLTEDKIDDLRHVLDGVLAQQQWQEATTIYGDDVQRLLFLLHILNNDLHVGTNGALRPVADAKGWADAVLSLSSDGIPQVMFDFHDMIMGFSPLFSRTPLFSLFVQSLDSQGAALYRQIIDFQDFTYTVQVSGYAAWATALNVNDQHLKIGDIQDLAAQRLEEQRLKTDEMLADFWADTCSSVSCDQNRESKEKCKLYAGTELTMVGFAVIMTLWPIIFCFCVYWFRKCCCCCKD